MPKSKFEMNEQKDLTVEYSDSSSEASGYSKGSNMSYRSQRSKKNGSNLSRALKQIKKHKRKSKFLEKLFMTEKFERQDNWHTVKDPLMLNQAHSQPMQSSLM